MLAGNMFRETSAVLTFTLPPVCLCTSKFDVELDRIQSHLQYISCSATISGTKPHGLGTFPKTPRIKVRGTEDNRLFEIF